MLDIVGIPGAARRANDYPHQFSGWHAPARDDRHGHSCDPDVLIADEPTTALDVTIQAQILDVLGQAAEEPVRRSS